MLSDRQASEKMLRQLLPKAARRSFKFSEDSQSANGYGPTIRPGADFQNCENGALLRLSFRTA